MIVFMQTLFQKVYKVVRNPAPLIKRLITPINSYQDFLIYKFSIKPYHKILKSMPIATDGGLLIMSGRGMNVVGAQVWTLLSLCGRYNNLKPYVLTTRSEKHIDRYYSLLDIELLYLEDFLDQTHIPLPQDFMRRINSARSMGDFRSLTIDNVPIGDIALSTYCRYHGTGLADTSQITVREFLHRWIEIVWNAKNAASKIFDLYNIKATYHTEVFMEEYGGFYYAALNAQLNVIRFAGTVRDDAYIIQHRSWGHDRLHHAALAKSTWNLIQSLPKLDTIQNELLENFENRYGNKWHRSKRNQADSKIIDVAFARAELGISAERKIAIVYSHILYDTLFFFGTDLFKDYATWLIETVREAILNDKLEWFSKINHSNEWRREGGFMFSAITAAIRLLEENFGDLPSHVHIIPADSSISPLTWMKLADFGITVRGTSGLEMAALGKTVITAGAGRYEGRGFTHDPKSKKLYRELLQNLPNVEVISPEKTEVACRYAHALFILKPFTISTLKPRIRSGVSKVVASDDLIYVPKRPVNGSLPKELLVLSGFLLDSSRVDLISETNYLEEDAMRQSNSNADT